MKSAIVSAYRKFIDKSLDFLSADTRNTLLVSFLDKLDSGLVVKTQYGPIRFYCPGGDTVWRAYTLFDKEPETLEWIDGFEVGDVLWDIGANVGSYSMYAARKGHRVFAFEPAFTNYYILNKNIHLNSLDNLVTAYCLAVADREMLGTLNMSNLSMGGALNQFGSAETGHVTSHGEECVFKQGMASLSVDRIAQDGDVEFPQHIKIDVDGIEELILNGALATLKDSRLKSVLIEVEEDDQGFVDRVKDIMASSGLKLVSRRHGELLEQGPWAHIYNYVFARD